MTDQEIREAGDADCIRSDINVLEHMVAWYDKRGGGHSQKEALNTAIKYLKQLVAVKGSGLLPEKKDEDILRKKFEVNGLDHHEMHEWFERQGHNQAIDLTARKLAKFLSKLEIKGIILNEWNKYDRLETDMGSHEEAEQLEKVITDYIKKEMGVSE